MTDDFDPAIAPFAASLPSLDLSDPVRARELVKAMVPAPAELPESVMVEDRMVPGQGTTEGPVRIRIYAPRLRRREPGRPDDPDDIGLPALIYFHGGGFVVGDLDLAAPGMARIVERLGVVVIAVDYRLAPEHPYPAAVDDCYSAVGWAAANAARLGLDPGRIGVGGDSAGGGLAAAVALLARDRGGPDLCFQYLGVPEVDDRLGTASMQAYHDAPSRHRPNAELSWKHYLGDRYNPGDPDVPAYAAPARAEDLHGLPPAHLTVCEFDPLRDEGLDYGRRLARAGVPVEVHMYAGTFHGSSSVATPSVSRRMWGDLQQALRRGLRV